MAVINPNTTVQSGGNQQTPNINAPGGSGAPMTSALSSAANTGSTAPSGSSAPATKAPNTQFTNVSAYLNANQGAGQKIANVVGSGLQSDVNNAQSTVDTTAQNFQNAVNAENNRLAQANQYLGTDSSGNQVFNGDATQVANNAQNYTNWQNLYNGTNVGELQSGLTNQAATAQNALTQAQTQVGQLGTESGRSQLLSQYLANPNYSAGQQNLDQLLFQVGGAQQLNNQQQSLNNTLTNLTNNQNTFQNSMQNAVTSNAQQINDTSTALKNAITNSLGDINNNATTAATTANTNNAAQNAALNTYFASGSSGGYGALSTTPDAALGGLSQQQYINNLLQQSGLTNGMQTYNVLNGVSGIGNNPYVTAANTSLNSNDVLSEQQYQQAAALAKLGQTTPGFVDPSTLGVSTGGPTINSSSLLSNINGAQQALMSQANADKINTSQNFTNQTGTTGTDTLNGIPTGSSVLTLLNDVLNNQNPNLSISSSFGGGNEALTPSYNSAGQFTGFTYNTSGQVNPGSSPTGQLTNSLNSQLEALINQYDLGKDNLGNENSVVSTPQTTGLGALLGATNRMG